MISLSQLLFHFFVRRMFPATLTEFLQFQPVWSRLPILGARIIPLFAITALYRDNIISIQCGDCKERNYSSTKNRKTTPDRLELKKFCKRCRKHTPHKEVK